MAQMCPSGTKEHGQDTKVLKSECHVREESLENMSFGLILEDGRSWLIIKNVNSRTARNMFAVVQCSNTQALHCYCSKKTSSDSGMLTLGLIISIKYISLCKGI